MNKRTVITLGVAGIAALGGGIFAVANAATSTSPGNLAQKIASTFNLDATKVQAVIDQNHQTNQADREAKYEQRLTDAVTAGKLTASQKTLILAEHQKLEAELAAATDSTRGTVMKAVRTEAKTWASSNNIDAKWLLDGGPRLRGGHAMPSPSPTPSS